MTLDPATMTPASTVGASDVPTILGLSPYADASPWAIWARLMGHPAPRPEDTPAQARGRMMEPGILLRMSAELGLTVIPNALRWYPVEQGTVCDKPTGAWRHATPDGLLWGPTEPWASERPPVAGAECKALRFLDGWGESGTDEVRTDYLAQVVWQMACCWLPAVYVGVFGTYHDEWRLYRVDRDLDLERRITHQVEDWYDRHVARGVPPDLDDTQVAARALSQVYSDVTGERMQAEPTDRQLVAQLRTLEEHLAEKRARRQMLRNQLQLRMGTATHLLHGSDVIARLTQPSRRDGSRRLTIIKEKDA